MTSPSIDAGSVDVPRVITARFEIANDGDAPLELSVQPPADVTVKQIDRQLAPQAKGTIQIEANTANASFEQARFKIVVKSNDPEHAETTLDVRALLRFAVNATPPFLRILGVRGEVESRKVTLTASDGTPFRVLGIVAKNVPFKAEGGNTTAAATQELVVTAIEDAPAGALAGSLEVRTDHPKRPTLQLVVSGFIRPPLSVPPGEMVFANLLPGRTKELSVKIYTSKPIEFKIPVCDVPFLTFEISKYHRESEHLILIKVAENAPKGPFTTTIRIGTSHPMMPLLEVPVRGSVY